MLRQADAAEVSGGFHVSVVSRCDSAPVEAAPQGRLILFSSQQECVRMPKQLGKRYQGETCNTEVLCIKPSNGEVGCCGVAMKLLQPKVLPSAD